VIYGQITESDELKSVKTGKWYEVLSTSTTETTARIRLKGVAKLLIKPIADEVPAGTHRRGQTGKAVDLFVVAFSGQNIPSAPETIPTKSESEEDQ
jgi:hypothetical protein